MGAAARLEVLRTSGGNRGFARRLAAPPATVRAPEAGGKARRGVTEQAKYDSRLVDAEVMYKAKEEMDRASVRLHEIAIAKSLREG